MKKSELKQLIREELEKELSRRDEEDNIVNTFRDQLTTKPTNKFSKEDILKKINQKRKEELERRRSEDINESLNSLKDNEYNIANAIENSNIPDKEFDPYTKMGVVNFIKKGSASQSYLEEMMGILKKYNIEVELTPTTPLPDRNIEDIEGFNTALRKYLK